MKGAASGETGDGARTHSEGGTGHINLFLFINFPN